MEDLSPQRADLWMYDALYAFANAEVGDGWPGIMDEFARVSPWAHARLDDAGWRRAYARFMLWVNASLAPHDPDDRLASLNALWARVQANDEPSRMEWEHAGKAERGGYGRNSARAAAFPAWIGGVLRLAADVIYEDAGSVREDATWMRLMAGMFAAIEKEAAGN